MTDTRYDSMSNCVVWEFVVQSPMPSNEVITIDMPVWAYPLSVHYFSGSPVLLVKVDPDAPRTGQRFQWIRSGQPVPASSRYVGSVYQNDGSPDWILVSWHLFHLGQNPLPYGVNLTFDQVQHLIAQAEAGTRFAETFTVKDDA